MYRASKDGSSTKVQVHSVLVTERSYEAYRDMGKNPYSYETWGEGTSLKQKESQNPTVVLNYLIFKKPENPRYVLNLIILTTH